jgi:hypothetical protein
VNRLVQENPNAILVESGNLSAQPDRVGLVMSVLAGLHYDAVGVGESDLRACSQQFFTEAEKSKLAVIDTRMDAPASTVPYVVKNVGGVKVGVVSFGATLPEQRANEYLRRKAMYKAYKAAREASDFLIVMDQGRVVTQDWLERNGKRLGVPDLVIGGLQQMALGSPRVFGKTQIVPTGIQGKQIGVVDVEITAGADPKVTWNRIQLDEGVVEDPKTKDLVQTFMVNSVQHQPVVPPVTTTQASAPTSPENMYYAPELCRGCHVKEYEDWARTKHAGAIKTLVDAKRMTPECLECHSEEYRRLKTVSIPEDNVGGVECATCHMDALPHDVERASVATRTKVNPLGCVTCHNKENSPKYDQQVYFPRIAHPGAKTSKSTTAAVPKSH